MRTQSERPARMSSAELEAANRNAAAEAVEWERWLPLAADRLFDRGWPVEKACDYCLAAGAVEDADQANEAARRAYAELDARQRAINRVHMER